MAAPLFNGSLCAPGTLLRGLSGPGIQASVQFAPDP
jgi:hypothetical protein